MKYSYNWLKEISGTKMLPEKAADLLTMHSFELEGMERADEKFENIVVGEILEIVKHPNADKLQIAKVNIGKEKLQIVCGAPNIAVGQKIPVALVGAKMTNGLEIKATEIRGEKSFGMLCAEDELGLGKNHDGIMLLDKKAKIGMSFAKYLGFEDVIFEIKVLPDRAHDAMSHVGVAREISILADSVKFGKEGSYDFENLTLSKKKSKKLKIEIKDKKLCPRYIGAVMENIVIKDSPSWMKARLEVCGIRPINNVVDATNYVMLELGQPLHAFDTEKISKNIKTVNNIVVRRAKKNEKLILLDESEIELNENNLLITNGESPLALAGVMGGRDSGISNETKTILIEAANFNAINIRRTRTQVKIRTESSDRFEKDIDPNLAEKAMVRIIEILEHTANAKLEGVIDIYPKKIKSWKIRLDLDYTNSLLGEKIKEKEIIKILNALGIKTKKSKFIDCEIPTFRIDLQTQEDLIEEIGRIWGYEKIEVSPLVEPVIPARTNEQLKFEQSMREKLVNFGFDEMYNYSFYSQKDAKVCGFDKVSHHKLSNPMNPDQELVRISLLPNILKNIKENLKHFESLNIFEIGRTYFPRENENKEKRMLMVAKVLEKDKNAETFYEMKGEVEKILESFGVRNAQFNNLHIKNQNAIHSGRFAEIKIKNEKIGMIFEVKPDVLSEYKISKRVLMVEIDLEKMNQNLSIEIIFKSIQKFPTVTRDISMIVTENVTYAEIKEDIEKNGGSLIENVEFLDYFSPKKSLAVRILMNGRDKTLESEEVDEVMKKIVSSLEKELKIEIRK